MRSLNFMEILNCQMTLWKRMRNALWLGTAWTNFRDIIYVSLYILMYAGYTLVYTKMLMCLSIIFIYTKWCSRTTLPCLSARWHRFVSSRCSSSNSSRAGGLIGTRDSAGAYRLRSRSAPTISVETAATPYALHLHTITSSMHTYIYILLQGVPNLNTKTRRTCLGIDNVRRPRVLQNDSLIFAHRSGANGNWSRQSLRSLFSIWNFLQIVFLSKNFTFVWTKQILSAKRNISGKLDKFVGENIERHLLGIFHDFIRMKIKFESNVGYINQINPFYFPGEKAEGKIWKAPQGESSLHTNIYVYTCIITWKRVSRFLSVFTARKNRRNYDYVRREKEEARSKRESERAGERDCSQHSD